MGDSVLLLLHLSRRVIFLTAQTQTHLHGQQMKVYRWLVRLMVKSVFVSQGVPNMHCPPVCAQLSTTFLVARQYTEFVYFSTVVVVCSMGCCDWFAYQPTPVSAQRIWIWIARYGASHCISPRNTRGWLFAGVWKTGLAEQRGAETADGASGMLTVSPELSTPDVE